MNDHNIRNSETQRIEAYISEVFTDVHDVKGALLSDGSPIRTYSLARIIPVGSTETVDEAICKIVDSMLMRLQLAFGVQPRDLPFYWRERPTISTWVNSEEDMGNVVLEGDDSTRVALWLRFGLEGWTIDTPLTDIIGQGALALTGVEKGELDSCSYMVSE